MGRTLPKIVTDIDDTKAVFWSEYVAWFNKVHETQYTPQELSARPSSIPRDYYEDCFYTFFETDAFANLPLVHGVKESIDGLVADGFSFAAVTFRSSRTHATTMRWLENNFPGVYRDLLCIHGQTFDEYADPLCTTKSQACKRLDAGIIVDDDPKVIIDCAGQGIQSFFLRGEWNTRVPYTLPPLSNAVEVKSWKEIEMILREQHRRY